MKSNKDIRAFTLRIERELLEELDSYCFEASCQRSLFLCKMIRDTLEKKRLKKAS